MRKATPQGPFRKNAMALEIVVFYYCRRFDILTDFAATFPREQHLQILAIANRRSELLSS